MRNKTQYDNIPDLLLYHYDLLLPRDSPLALHGNVPPRLAKILGKKVEVDQQNPDVPVEREQEKSMNVESLTNNFSPVIFSIALKVQVYPRRKRRGYSL